MTNKVTEWLFKLALHEKNTSVQGDGPILHTKCSNNDVLQMVTPVKLYLPLQFNDLNVFIAPRVL
jgi:hypothetical protein